LFTNAIGANAAISRDKSPMSCPIRHAAPLSVVQPAAILSKPFRENVIGNFPGKTP
jgi:hypothetical protein